MYLVFMFRSSPCRAMRREAHSSYVVSRLGGTRVNTALGRRIERRLNHMTKSVSVDCTATAYAV